MRYILLLLLLISSASFAPRSAGVGYAKAMQDFSLFEKRTFITATKDTLPYRILFPEGYDKSKKYPLVLFLHGGGEKGRDNEKQLIHGVKVFLDPENRKKYPCIVIAPQCMPNDTWSSAKVDRSVEPAKRDFNYSYPITKSLAAVEALTKHMIANESVGKKQVYVTGLSMGGMGTYEMVGRNPGLFEAAVAVCGGGDPNSYSKKQAKTRFWIFHGSDDHTVEVKFSREMFGKLKALKADVKYTEYPGVGHNSWEKAYTEPDLLSWMFNKAK